MFVDTAPVIYFVERHPIYFGRVDSVFKRVDSGDARAVTSPITLAECLVGAQKRSLSHLLLAYDRAIAFGVNTYFAPIGWAVGVRAASLRATYHVCLSGALQLAIAIESGCDAFLTNDLDLLRVREIPVIVVDRMQEQDS